MGIGQSNAQSPKQYDSSEENERRRPAARCLQKPAEDERTRTGSQIPDALGERRYGEHGLTALRMRSHQQEGC